MSNDSIELTLPAELKYLNILAAVIDALLAHAPAIPEKESLVYNIQLAVHELCTNIIEHAYQFDSSQSIQLHLHLKQAELRIRITDQGRAFDPQSVPRPDLDGMQERGMGLFLAYELLDEVKYSPETHCNRWFLKKTIA